MITDIQRSGLIKRFSAALLDFILLAIVVVGFAYIFSVVFKYDEHAKVLEEKYTYYEEKYGVRFDITIDEFEALTEDEKDVYNSTQAIMNEDLELTKEYNLLVSLTQLSISISVLLGMLLLDFVVPMVFKNGETIGKKVFGICLVKTNGVKISTVQLLIRTLLGKYTIETMIPVNILLFVFFNIFGYISIYFVVAFFVAQLILVVVTNKRTMIHDLLAYTVVVDKQTQMIFDSEESLIKYKEEAHFEEVKKLKS